MAERLITNLGGIEPQRARLVALMHHEWNPERTALLRELCQEGRDSADIAKILDVTPGCIREKIRRMKAQWEAQA